MHRARLVLLLVAFVHVAALAAQAPAIGPAPGKVAEPAGLDALVERVRSTFDVPGISLAIVKDNAVVTAKGYGLRKLGDTTGVDAGTLFAIASNSKVFTATALGLLVEEGKLAWDAPVIRYLPWFRMSDPFVTNELTIRDLLVHRSGLGLGAGDLLWWPPSTYTRREVAERLRLLPLATSFRSAYAYDNVLYLVAGEVIEAISGVSWEDFIRTRILARVGMRASHPRFDTAANSGNVASPHARIDERVRVVNPFASDNTNPAGGILSNATDMAAWMRVLLNRGQLADDTRLFSERTWREISTLVTPMPNPDPPAELAPLKSFVSGYALGLNVREYRGHLVLTHTGGLPGFVSRVFLMPDIGLGVSVLTNQESGEAFNAIAYFVADAYLGVPPTDWVAAYGAVRARGLANVAAAELKSTQARDAASKPSLPLARYAGTFTDAWYGDIVIEESGGRLAMRFSKTPALVGTMEHWQHDTFVVRWTDRELRADAFVTFALKPDGTIEQAKMAVVSPSTDFSFDFQDLLLRPRLNR
jgi:CubicO group peptidase (beta-lactamase class C family)